MFRHSLHILRSTPQTLFSAFKHSGNTKHTLKTALTPHSVNHAYGKPFTGSLNGIIGVTSIAYSESTGRRYTVSHMLHLVFVSYCFHVYFFLQSLMPQFLLLGRYVFLFFHGCVYCTGTILDYVCLPCMLYVSQTLQAFMLQRTNAM